MYTGVDYARFTSLDHAPVQAWKDLLLAERLKEEHAGRKTHMRWMLGYYGQVGEHYFLGENENGAMVQVSGTLAWHKWRDLGNYSERCTRIDLQVTWPCEDEPGLYIRSMYDVGKLHRVSNGRPPELQLTDTPRGAKMLTVGSRQSLVYGRMYDKERESGMPEYKRCVRWEIEVKAEQAKDLNQYLRRDKLEIPHTRAIVQDFWTKRGMTPFWECYEAMYEPPPVKRSKTDETKLAWIVAQVRPTLKTLLERGRVKDAIRALFGDDLTDEQVAAITASLNVVDGD
jgi:hypothetical protein